MKKVLLTATVQSHICQFHRPLVEVLHSLGYEVHVAAKNNLAEKNGLKLDFADKVFDVPFSRSPKSADNIRAYKMLKKIINAEKYDVIHCNTPMGGIITRLAAKKTRKLGTKVFYTVHGFHFYKGASKKNWLVFYPIERLFAKKTDKLITINEEDFNLSKAKFHCKTEHIHGIGVDEKRYFPCSEEEKKLLREKMGFLPDQKIILCIGELLPNKNQAMAIRAIKKLSENNKNILLLIAGNGPHEEAIKSEITACGVGDCVKMLGYVTNLQDYQHISDVLVACSKREGLGLNVIEAMMSGNPVVATKNRGHSELLDDGKNGFLVEFNDYDKMADDISKLLSDEKTYKLLQHNGIEFARKYSAFSVKSELKEIYVR